MSDAYAQVFTPDGDLLGYTIYQGSADLVHPGISPEFTWEPGGWDRRCEHEGEPCIVYESYGGGCWFESRYCSEHAVLTGELSQWGDPVTGEGGIGREKLEERSGQHPFPALSGTDHRGGIRTP